MKKQFALLLLGTFIFSMMFITSTAISAKPDEIASSTTFNQNFNALTDFASGDNMRTTESYSLDSPHPYTNSYDNTWTITKSGASDIRVYFSMLQTESNYDYVYVYDGSGTQLNSFTGSHDGTWSAKATGDTIKIRLKTDYSVTTNGFTISQIDFTASVPPPTGGSELQDGVPATGSLDTSNTMDDFTIAVGANAQSLRLVLDTGSSDYDLYQRFGTPVEGCSGTACTTYDNKGYTSGGEDITISSPAEGTHYITVIMWSGGGSYTLTATITYNTPTDTTNPTVSITAPSNGATVSGAVSITMTATDNVGVSSRAIKIDGVTVSTGTSYSWDTTTATNAAHTITATATDAAGNTGTDSITVTVDNQVTPPPSNQLENGVTAYGNLATSSDFFTWTLDVASNAVSMHVVLNCGASDYDFFASHLTTDPTHSVKEFEGYTGGGEDVTFDNPGAGTWYIKVDAYSGSGAYDITATVVYQQADTTAPTVSITNPSNGATVSGTVSITFTATDNVGVTSRAIKIDGTTVSTGTSYSWDTTTATNAAHIIRVEASDAVANVGYSQISVTVNNQAPPTGTELTDGEAYVGGPLSDTNTIGADLTIQVDADAQSMHIVLDSGANDFDIYQRFNAEVGGCSGNSCSTYDNRGYTSGGEDITVNSPAQGTHHLTVVRWSGTGTYTLTVSITYGGSSGGGDWGTGGKYAVIWGISDYQYINDLSYCDEDASDVYSYLTGKGYEVHVLGDTHTSNFPRYDGDATEANVRAEIQSLASVVQPGDQVVIWASSHGGATGTYDGAWQSSGSTYAGNDPGTGYSYLLMYDFSSSPSVSTPRSSTDESYSAQELGDDLALFASGVKTFVGIDACQSGAFGWYLMQQGKAADWVITTACGVNGYGYDQSSYSNGAFTYWFMEYSIVNNGRNNAEDAFTLADSKYNPSNAADEIHIFDGNTGVKFVF